MCPIIPPPPGTWCNVPCNGPKTACMVLDEILQLAQADQVAGRIGPGMVAMLTGLTGKCGLNSAQTTLPTAQHVQKVNAARAAAAQHNWPLCIEHLEHGH